jgi:hypothetical protein
MRIGYFCESPADRAAMAVFTEGILGLAPKPISVSLDTFSLPAFFSALDGTLRNVYYNSDAEALVIVVDCDDTPLHDHAHELGAGGNPRCRFCQLRNIVAQTKAQLKPRHGGQELKVAIGLTVPAIEAWYLVGKNHQVGEAAWKVGLAAGKLPFTRPQLKKLVYGTDRPSLEHATACAEREARRIIADLTAIETAFPVGFGLMAKEIRSWVAPKPGA